VLYSPISRSTSELLSSSDGFGGDLSAVPSADDRVMDSFRRHDLTFCACLSENMINLSGFCLLFDSVAMIWRVTFCPGFQKPFGGPPNLPLTMDIFLHDRESRFHVGFLAPSRSNAFDPVIDGYPPEAVKASRGHCQWNLNPACPLCQWLRRALRRFQRHDLLDRADLGQHIRRMESYLPHRRQKIK
jgi:hypothetical protein